MSTVIRLSGVRFNNPDLPKISPLVINGFVADGLRAAFRPAQNATSLIDLSGNETKLTAKGTPEYTSFGVKGDYANGLQSDVPESRSLTQICAVRLWHNKANNLYANYAYLGNTYYPSGQSDGSGVRGYSQYIRALTDTGISGNVFLRHYVECFGVNPDGNTSPQASANRYQNFPSASIAANAPEPTGWLWYAITVDADTNFMYNYTPALNYYSAISFANNPTIVGPGAFANRLISNNITGAPNKWSIFVTPKDSSSSPGSGLAEIAEIALWNRALTRSELDAQYSQSKSWLSQNRGIMI